MADVITRFKLETTQFDSKLRDTAKALKDVTHQASLGGKDFDNFSKEAIKSAQALGTVASGANNTKDKLRDLVGSYNDAAKAYNELADKAKQGEFGKAMSASLQQLQQRIKETKEELYSLGDNGVMQNLKGVLNGVAGKFGMSASMFTGVGASVAGAAGVFKLVGDNINLAMNFEKSMSQLSSLTGMVGKDLDQLKEYAIELGSTSTLTASQVADAFRLIGSQQPQLLESGQALKEVTKYAITLSEAAGIDLQTAAQTLSTSINQMGGDSNNAARYVNVLAAASQKGAGDIAWLGEAITKSATAAKAVGTDYEELVANLEQLAKAGFDASTAGTALRSIIMNLEKQANNDFKPSIVGLTQAFENLGKANLDIVGYQQIAGKMFASQAMALANAAQEAKNMTTAITGTNTAMEQASTNTANLDGAMKSLSSAWEGFNLHINSSSGFLKDCVDWAAELIRKLDGVATAGGRAAKALQQMNGAGGSEGPTKVDQQINALKGSNHKRAAFNLTMQSYRQQLADYDQKIANGGKWESKDKPGFFHYENVDILKAQRAALAQMAKEFQTRGLRELNYTISTSTGNKGNATLNIEVEVDDDEGEKSLDSLKAKLKELKKLRDEAINKKDFKARDTYNAQIKQVNAEIKSLRGGSTTTTTTHQTPQQRTQESFTKAEQNYKQALEQAAMELEAGTITRAEAKKKEMQAAEQRWKAIGDARNISDSPELKQAQNEAAANYKALAAEVNARIEAQKKQQEATRQLEQAEKKVADAMEKSADAWRKGDLQGYMQAQKSVGGDVSPAIGSDAFRYTSGNLDAFIGNLKQQLSQADIGSDLYNNLTAQLSDATLLGNLIQTAIKNGIDMTEFNPQELWSKVFGDKPGDYISNEDWQKKLGIISKQTGKKIQFNPQTGEIRDGKKKGSDDLQEFSKDFSAITGSVNGILSGIQNLGIEIPEGLAKTIGAIQTISSILTAILAITSIIQASSTANATASWIDAIIPFAHGGMIKAFSGTLVGNTYSGDQLRGIDNQGQLYGLNAGEVVLNRAQTGNIASQLQGSMGAMQLSAIITGEQLRLVLNNNGRRTGRGEYVTTNFR